MHDTGGKRSKPPTSLDDQGGNLRAGEALLHLIPERHALFAAHADDTRRVRATQEESAIELSKQSKERALVGEVISTVALADQISREKVLRGVSPEGERK